MCGIAGILGRPGAGPPSFQDLRRMAATLRHRGPDGYGLYCDDRVGLAHTRLSILDLEGGAQPMSNEARTVWVVFNGEVFNHVELRNELQARGHRFRTRSDTEVIVQGFEQWGAGAWRRLNGQFAIALWDSRDQTLWLVRDRLGILPLHYSSVDGRVGFASEAKALFAGGLLAPRFDEAGVAQVFSRWAATAPATVFAGIRSVPPGTSVRIDAQLREQASCYWQLDLAPDPAASPRSVAEAAEQLEDRLRQAIRLRLQADVPVGAYLSGGLDSSVIARLAVDSDASRLQTFSLRFNDPAFDETEAQRRMAEILGTSHHEILCRDSDIRDALPEVVWRCETPLLRTGPVPMYLLSELVRRSGMKVVLTGEGADELLAGYSIFKEDKVRRFWARNPGSATRPGLLSRVHPYIADSDQRATAMWREFYRRDLGSTGAPFYSHAVRWENTAWAMQFLAPGLRARHDAATVAADLAGAMPPGWMQWPSLARAQAIEIMTFMSPYLLSSQGDRVAMGHGVEVRYPFLDPEVVAFCSRLPGPMKLCGLRDKVALRTLAARALPAEVWQRPKRPYRAPTTTALFGDGPDDYVQAMLSSERLALTGLVDPVPARRLVDKATRTRGQLSEREGMALVGLLTLQLLADQFQDGLAARVTELARKLADVAPDVMEDHSSVPAADGRREPPLAAVLRDPS